MAHKRTDPSGMEIVDTRAQQIAALDIVDTLHERGFTRVWLESVRMFSGGLSEPGRPPQVQHFQMRVIVDEVEIYAKDMLDVMEVAAEHDAGLSLTNLRMNQQEFSRVTLWPRGDN